MLAAGRPPSLFEYSVRVCWQRGNVGHAVLFLHYLAGESTCRSCIKVCLLLLLLLLLLSPHKLSQCSHWV